MAATAAKGESVEIKIANVDEVPTGVVKKIHVGISSSTPAYARGFRAFGSISLIWDVSLTGNLMKTYCFCPCHLGKFDRIQAL